MLCVCAVVGGHGLWLLAVETYANSGSYFLIETTTLPYDGLNGTVDYTDPAFYNGLLASSATSSGTIYWTTSGSSEEWARYFDAVGNDALEFGGVFIIDCNLQQVMEIQGLESV